MAIEFDSRKCLASPIGPITLFANGEKLVGVELSRKTKDIGNSKALTQATNQLERYFNGKLKSFDVPIEWQGTPFQVAVWEQIAKIPFGQSLSYADIAHAIGKPRAFRAVGGAVGANPVPLIVGCHRVLGSSGAITGYSGGKGIVTKKWLLRHEGIQAN